MLSKRKIPRFSVCPKTGKVLKQKGRFCWAIWLFPIAGLVSLIWFLIRVIPKPSRATYPCQRVAMPLASGFIVWLIGLIGSTLAYRKARRLLQQSRYILAGIFAAMAVGAVWWSLSITGDNPAKAAWTPTDPPNSPVGVARGVHPGRVVWVHEPNATRWDGVTGSWWDDSNTDQQIVDYMVRKAIRTLTAEPNDAKAWNALFRYFNQSKGFGDVVYQYGEKIAIKINMNQDYGGAWGSGSGMPSPHVIYSLLNQLINVAGVPGSAITIYDASRYIGNPIYNKVRSNPDPNFQDVKFVVSPSYAGSGRIAATYNTNDRIYFADPGIATTYVPQCTAQAKYLINMALFRQHQLYAVTLCGKNHFGSVRCGGQWSPAGLHIYGDRNRTDAQSNCLVDLIGYKHLGGKTLLYMIDGLYSAAHQSANVIRFQSFGNDWCSSIFASQDPVAIDSVALDFLRNEPTCNLVYGNVDHYLHEAAEANNPPSGTFYDPDHSGQRLASLGVHEHWNNATDKKYSRNLGTGNGIELLKVSLAPNVDFDDNGKVDFNDFAILAQYWCQGESPVDIAPPPLGDGKVELNDLDIFTESWLTGAEILLLPGPVSNSNPHNGATDVAIEADLSWTAGSDAISHNLYFGTSNPVLEFWNCFGFHIRAFHSPLECND